MRRWRGDRRALWLALLLAVAVSVLAALPTGIRMNFSGGPDGPIVVQYYSYFAGMPLFYGNWFPLLCALLSVVLAALMLVVLLKKQRDKGRENGLKIVTMVDFALSFFAMLIVGNWTPVAIAISALLLLVAVLEFWTL